jgi:beta-galactosidase
MGGFKEYWDLVRKYPKYQGGFIWDFVDQGLRDKSPITGKEIFTYGGDYGRYPASDYNFNCNGIIAPDRRLNPHAYEVGYYYQDIWVTDKGLKDGKFEVYNENFFKSLDGYQLEWKVKKHGGKIDLKGIAPQQRKTFVDDQLKQTLTRVMKHHAKEEICVNFTCTLDGQMVARQQFVVQPYQFPKLTAEQAAVDKEETKSYVKLMAGGTTLTIGKQSGMIDYLDVDGQSMLVDRQSITPEFWRAPTDNDYGAWMQRRFAQWKAPQMKVASLAVNENAVVATIDMPDVKGQLTMTYTLQADGAVLVRQQMKVANDSKESWLFRYGMQLQMLKQYNQIEYYGRGPHENYCDRNSSEFLGYYYNKVKDEYFPYIRPQESGNHTDIRWFQVTDGKCGLKFESDAPIECSALPYLVEDLDAGMHKDHRWGQHSGDLVERPLTQVHIQQKQMGLGCVNSWGAWPEKPYMLPAKQGYDFTYRIIPVREVK